MHFYEKTAAGVEPRHFVPMATRPGELRPTRMADARKHGWYASVTTIQGMLDKPGLNNWRIDEHLKLAYSLHSNSDIETLEQYISRIKNATQEELDKAPQEGTDFHDVMEQYINGELPLDSPFLATAQAVAKLVTEYSGNALEMFIPERSFVNPMGYAGKVDAHIKDVGEWVIDFKTKNSADKWKPGKMNYPEMAQQLAAYRVGLDLHNARCANVFVCIPTGQVEFYEWGPETLDREWANFSDLLRIWLRNAQYIPGKPA